MKKHLLKLWILLLFVAALFALPMTAQAETSGTCGDNLTWVLDDEGNLTISGTGAMTSYSYSVRAPWGTTVKSVVIQDGVTSIGNHAFYDCSSLTSITLPDGVTSIGDITFYFCSNLTSITLPDSLTSIGDSAFYCCNNLTSVKLPDGLTSIGSFAFSGCSNLTSITLPDGLTSIGGGNSDSSRPAIIKAGTTTEETCIKNSICFAYADMEDFILRVDIDNTTGTRKTTLVKYVGTDTEVIIPDFVTSIGASAFDGCSNLTSITLPDSVTSIGQWAFHNCSSLTSIMLPDAVVSIGNQAFWGCSSLTDITLPDGLTSIGDHVFNGCSSLTSITIPDGVTNIGEFAFYGCSSLTSIALPDDLTSIGDYAFSDCKNLTSVKLPDGLTTIGKSSFSASTPAIINAGTTTEETCLKNSIPFIYADMEDFVLCVDIDSETGVRKTTLEKYVGTDTEVIIPDFVTSIGSYAFYNRSTLTSVTLPDSVTSIGDHAFYDCSSLTSITLPDSVTSIGDYAFSDCSSLTSITLPDSVTSIGDDAFYGCSSLTSITIPDGVTSIGDYAFTRCSSLISIKLPDGLTTIGIGAFSASIPAIIKAGTTTEETCLKNRIYFAYADLEDFVLRGDIDSTTGTRRTTLVDYIGTDTEVIIPDAVTSIGDYAFSDCKNLTSIALPDGVTSIGDSAFNDCSNLTSITLPDSVTSIGDYAFSDCSSLSSITIPNSVTSIGDYAFFRCSCLNSVKLPDGLTSIGGGNFDSSRPAIIKAGTTTEETCLKNSIPFIYADMEDFILRVDIDNTTGTRKTTLVDYVGTDTEVIIPDFVTSVGDEAFFCCNSLTSVKLPDGLTSIGASAFDGCYNLTSITLPDGLTSIGSYNFDPSRPAIIKAGTTTEETCLKNSIFFTYADMEDFILRVDIDSETGVRKTTLEKYVGTDTEVIIPDFVTSIGNHAFHDCRSLSSITIPDGVTSIGTYAFTSCSGLTSIALPDGLTSIGSSAFSDCSSLSSITIPDSVTSIGGYAFDGCRSLSSITIPDSVTSIGTWAFSYCSSLSSITIPDSVTSIGDYAFYDCSSLSSITIPDSVTSIGNYAFSGCSNLTSITLPSAITSIGYLPFQNDNNLTAYVYEKTYAHTWCKRNYSNYKLLPPFTYTVSDDKVTITKYIGLSTEVDIPPAIDGSLVVDIADGAFAGNDKLTSVEISQRTESIGARAFADCTNLSSVTINCSTTSIAKDAFAGCDNLTISVCEGSYAHTWCEQNGQKYKLIPLFDYTVSDGEATITGYHGAYGDITIPAAIDGYPVRDVQLDLEWGVKYDLSKTVNVFMPDTLTKPFMVRDFTSDYFYLVTRPLPNTLTHFWVCYADERGELATPNPDDFGHCVVDQRAEGFGRWNQNCVQPDDEGKEYVIIFDLENPGTEFTVPAEFDGLPVRGMAQRMHIRPIETLEKLTVSEGIRMIEQRTICDFPSLREVILPRSVCYIDSYNFTECSEDLVVYVYENSYAHTWCVENNVPYKLIEVNIPYTYTIDNGKVTITGYTGTETAITIPATVEGCPVVAIADGAFEGNTQLISLVIPDSVKRIGDTAFSGCTGLQRIFIDGDQSPSYTLPSPLSEATVYCYEYSEIDYWAVLNGYKVAYLDLDGSGVGLSITMPESMTLWAGETGTINADVFPPIAAEKLVWSTTNSSIATVKDGIVTAHSAGTTEVSLSYGSISEKTVLTVHAVPVDFSLPDAEIWLVTKEKQQLAAIEIKPDGAIGEFTWSSADTAVLNVDNQGILTALRPGDAVLTVKEEKSGISKTCTVHVVYPVDTITFAESELQMKPGETKQLTATVTTRDQTLTNKLVTFSSSDEKVATVDQNGVVTALTEGTVTITATASNGVSTSCTIKVQLLGDANGDGKVDAADALVVLQYSAGWDVTVNTAKADVTGDGMIGISDALKILQDCMGGDIAKAMRALQRMLADLNASTLVIIEQPADQQVIAGERAAFTVTATGDALKYQWYIDRNDGTGWHKLNNATDATYVTSKTEADNDGYQYRCVITDAHGNEATTDVAVLHVVLDMPNTGDASTPALWLAMCMLSMIGLMSLKRRTAVE